MKISAVINSRVIKSKAETKDSLAIIIFILLLIGIICGNLLYILSEEYISSSLIKKFLLFSTDFSGKSKIEVFSGIFLSHIPYFLFSVISGVSAWGYWLSALSGTIKVSGLGIIGAYLYSVYALKGLEYAALVIFPGKLILLFGVIILMNLTIRTSLNIKGILKGDNGKYISMSEYYIKSIICVTIFAFSALTDCLTLTTFSQLFEFS